MSDERLTLHSNVAKCILRSATGLPTRDGYYGSVELDYSVSRPIGETAFAPVYDALLARSRDEWRAEYDMVRDALSQGLARLPQGDASHLADWYRHMAVYGRSAGAAGGAVRIADALADACQARQFGWDLYPPLPPDDEADEPARRRPQREGGPR